MFCCRPSTSCAWFCPAFEIQNSSMCQPSSDPVLKRVGSQLGNLSSEELDIDLASFWGEGGVVSFVATPEYMIVTFVTAAQVQLPIGTSAPPKMGPTAMHDADFDSFRPMLPYAIRLKLAGLLLEWQTDLPMFTFFSQQLLLFLPPINFNPEHFECNQ